MNSIKVSDNSNNYSIVDEAYLVNSNLTNWAGWLCSIGQINIDIRENGNVLGGNCPQRLKYGNLYDPNFIFNPIKNFSICTQSKCICFHDISIHKLKNKKYLTGSNLVKKSELKDLVSILPTDSDKYDYKITWLLHTKCNFLCSYCPPNLHSGKTIDINAIEIGFLNFCKIFSNNKIMLNFLGGEPTLYDDLPDKIKMIKELNSTNRILITTNGSRSFKYLKTLAKYAELSFSIHLHQLSIHKLADKINQFSKCTDIQPFQVHILYPSTSDNLLKDFLNKLDNINYYIRVIKLREMYNDSRIDYYKYSFKQNKLIQELNNYFENLN